MDKIRNYNCEGMCQQALCDKRYTRFEEITLYGVKIIVSLCDEHAEKWENNFWKTPREQRFRAFPLNLIDGDD